MSLQRQLLLASLLALLNVNSAQAATITIGVDDALVTINDKVAEARYRLSQTNWDQTIFNGTDFTASNIITNNLGSATALNGKSWDFMLRFDSGLSSTGPASGVKGLTFSLTDSSGMANELVYNNLNPINGVIPNDPFNAIKIEARAGQLRDDNSSASFVITDLVFFSPLPQSGTLPGSITVGTGSLVNEDETVWLVADTDLGAMDYWYLAGTVTGDFDCIGSAASCLRDESIKLNVKLADVSVVPVPGAVWLLGSGLLALLPGFRRIGAI